MTEKKKEMSLDDAIKIIDKAAQDPKTRKALRNYSEKLRRESGDIK